MEHQEEPQSASSELESELEDGISKATEAVEVTEETFSVSKVWLDHYPTEVAPSLNYPEVNIAQFLIDAAERYPDHHALYFMGKKMTYAQLYSNAKRLAQGLVNMQIEPGDRVAIMLPNSPQAVISYYGVLLAGAVVVQTNPLFVERELLHQLRDSGAKAIIMLDLMYSKLKNIQHSPYTKDALPNLQYTIVTTIKDGLPFPKNILYPLTQKKQGFQEKVRYGTDGVVAYKKILHNKALDTITLPELKVGEALAALQYSGGTTGVPKGVMLTHRNLVVNTLQTAAWCYKIDHGAEKYLAALPLFHVFGLTVLMNLSVYSSGMLILLPRFDVLSILKTIESQQPTIFPGAPTMYVALINHPKAAELDMSSIEVCISGSAGLPLEVQEQFEELTGGRLIEGYGLTEASPVTHANPIWGKRKSGTIGIPFPDTEAAVVDPITWKLLPPNTLGELVIRGPQVMAGYWNREDETANSIKDGWLRTGDLATMDEEGYFTIMDRIKDVIIAGGFNIYPREVEEVLYEHQAVKEAAVIGIYDKYRGETVKAFIVTKDGYTITEEQLDTWCRANLASFKVPHVYEFREQLPKTMVGKVLRRQLIEEEKRKKDDRKDRK